MVISIASSVTARAAEVENEAVRNREFTVEKRVEVGANFGLTILNMLTSHIDASADVAYNFTEAWALVLGGGYAFGSHTSVANDVFREVGSKDPVPPCPTPTPPGCVGGSGALSNAADFANLWMMQEHAELNLRWSPIYGKLNLAGELPVHFQVFITAGGGAADFQFYSPVFCLQRGMVFDPDDPNNNDTFTETSSQAQIQKSLSDTTNNTGAKIQGCVFPLSENTWKPVINFGGGLRVFITKNIAIKLEFRDYIFPDQYFININRTAIGGGALQGQPGFDPSFPATPNLSPSQVNAYCTRTGNCQNAPNAGFTNLVFFNGGLQWLF
jgi:outer membrane beta-barrel protein